MTRRFGLMILLGCGVLAAMAGIGRLKLDPDVLGMLPSEMPEVRGLRLFHENFARQDELVLLIEGGEEDEGVLAEYAESLAGKLDAAGVARRVRWRTEFEEEGDGLAELLAYFWLNGEEREIHDLTETFSPERRDESLQAAVAAVAVAMEGEEMVMRANDPFGLLRHASVEVLWQAAAQGGAGFESENGRGHLVLLEAPGTVNGYREAEAWVEQVREVVEDWRERDGDGLVVRITGEPVFSSEIGGAMERDMRGTAGITLGLIGVLFWWMQRRLKLLAGLMVTLGLVFLVTLGLAGWIYGELSIMAAGFAAVLIGLVVDYGVLICQEAKVAGHDGRAVFRATGKSIFWAALTTALVFLALNLSGLRGIGHMGTLVACGIGTGALLMLGFYRPYVAWAGEGRAVTRARGFHPGKTRKPGWIAAGLAVAALASLMVNGVPGIGFDAKMMRPRGSTAMEGFERMQALFPQWNAEALRVVVEADDSGKMREKLAEAARRAEEHPLVESLELPDAWWPDRERQKRNAEILTNWLKGREELLKAAGDAGFSDEGLALSRVVLEALEKMGGEKSVVFPESEVAGEMMRMFLRYREDGTGGMVGVLRLADGVEPGGKDHAALGKLSGEGIWLAGWDLLRPALMPLVTRDLRQVFLPMAFLIVTMLALMFRSVKETLLMVGVLCLSGMLLLAVMGWCGMRWNFLNVAAAPLLLGIGIDYGIHVLMALRRNGGDVEAMWQGTGKAVLFCGSTTAIAFGSLCLSSNDALVSLGAVAVIGILISLLVSLCLLPGWMREK